MRENEAACQDRLRRAYQAEARAGEAPLDAQLVAAYLDGTLEPAERAALEERLVAEPAASGQVAEAIRQRGGSTGSTGLHGSRLQDWLNRLPATSEARRRWLAILVAGVWLGARPLRLPAPAVSFASDLAEPYSCRLLVREDLTVSLVEEAGGLLAVYARSDDRELAGCRLRLALTPEAGGEPLEVELPLEDLGEGGCGGHVYLGHVRDLVARLGNEPECVAVLV